MTTTERAYRTTTIQGQTVCDNCWTHAAASSEENYFDHLIEKLGRPAAEARFVAVRGYWSDEDHDEIERWALALVDDGYDMGTMCDLHRDEIDAHDEDALRTATAEAEAEDAAALAAEELTEQAIPAAVPAPVKVKDRVTAAVPVTGTDRRREIVGTVTASQVTDAPGLGPWGTVVVKELGRNLYHAVDHRTVTKIARNARTA